MYGQPNARRLKGLEGTMVVAVIPALGDANMHLVRLHKVDTAGIWIESQDLTQQLMERCEMAVSRTTVLMFVPYSGVSYVLASIDSVSLSERALGLSEGTE